MTPQQAARRVKADKLADVLDAVLVDTGATPDALTDEAWLLAERIAGVRTASPETRHLVVSTLNERARWRQPSADPFDGLVPA